MKRFDSFHGASSPADFIQIFNNCFQETQEPRNLFIRKSICMITSSADMFRHTWSPAYLFLLREIVMDNHLQDMGLREYNHSLPLQKPQIEPVEANWISKYRSNKIVYRTHDLYIFSLMLSRKRYRGAWIEHTTFILLMLQKKFINNISIMISIVVQNIYKQHITLCKENCR